MTSISPRATGGSPNIGCRAAWVASSLKFAQSLHHIAILEKSSYQIESFWRRWSRMRGIGRDLLWLDQELAELKTLLRSNPGLHISIFVTREQQEKLDSSNIAKTVSTIITTYPRSISPSTLM